MPISTIQPPPPRSAPILSPGSASTQGRLAGRAIGSNTNHVVAQVWSGWFRRLTSTLNNNLSAGFSGTVALAKLTSGGTAGSLTVTNGIITAYVAPT